MHQDAAGFEEKLRQLTTMSPRPMNSILGSPGFDLPNIDHHSISLASNIPSQLSNSVHVKGENLDRNWIVFPPKGLEKTNFTLHFGKAAVNNIVVLGSGSKLTGSLNLRGDGGIAIFGEETRYSSHFQIILARARNLFFWGRSGSSNGLNIFVEGNDTEVIIGNDCMASQRPTIITSDVHTIVDDVTHEWLNPPRSILLEPHVWLGLDAMILKGTTIGFGSVIGARALVTQNVPRRSIAAGSPAKIIKSGIKWIRPDFPQASALAEVDDVGRHFRSP